MPRSNRSLYPPPSADFVKFPSRRSVVHSTEGIVSCTQPLAAKCGLEILRAGGNAADAAVAVAAGLNMTEPCQTGIGGDMFILYWDNEAKAVRAMNGSGRSGAACTLDRVRADLGLADGEPGDMPTRSVHAVTVPGAAAGWVDTVERFGSGKVSLGQVLEPAAQLGDRGFPVSEIAAYYWAASENLIRGASPNFAEMLKKDPSAPDGVRAPRPGDIMRNPTLAETFRTLGREGKKGFYAGRVAEEIVRVVGDRGGHLTLDDLRHHMDNGGSETVDPVSVKFAGQGLGQENGVELWEHPPNGQGVVALMALGIIQELEKQGKIPTFGAAEFNTAAYLHAVVEALRLGFADASWYVTDPDFMKVRAEQLLDPGYLAERAKLFDPNAKVPDLEAGRPDKTKTTSITSPALQSSDTVYFAVSDAAGNAASFIISNYGGFGTAMVPRGCGFTLQNRGANFSLDAAHPNRLEPRKRPYHTIIPGMATNLADGTLHSAFGVMGGFMQPQGHVQVLLAQLVGGLNPQQALDAPRICLGPGMPGDEHDDGRKVLGWTVNVEEGMPEETVEGLKRRGHNVVVVKDVKRSLFGRGQIIRYTVDEVDGTGIWSAGSDLRGDGAAYPL